MRFRIKTQTAIEFSGRGFTLMEMLVALAFMALVVPVAVKGMKLASLAGEVSQRKAQAMRIAEKVLNETIVTGQWNQNSSGGSEKAVEVQYRWTMRNEPWAALANATTINTSNGVNQGVVSANNLHVLSVDVSYPAQGQNYAVHLSTVINITQQAATANLPPAQ